MARFEGRNDDVTLENAQLFLKSGVTTVRDSYGQLRSLIRVRDAIARGDSIGPRMLVAGNIVGWGGPFSISFSYTRDTGLSPFQERFNDEITQGAGENLMDMTPEELRRAINAYLDKGPNFIKYGGTTHHGIRRSSASRPRRRKSSSTKPTSAGSSPRRTRSASRGCGWRCWRGSI